MRFFPRRLFLWDKRKERKESYTPRRNIRLHFFHSNPSLALFSLYFKNITKNTWIGEMECGKDGIRKWIISALLKKSKCICLGNRVSVIWITFVSWISLLNNKYQQVGGLDKSWLNYLLAMLLYVLKSLYLGILIYKMKIHIPTCEILK